ncbi:MAG: hypothetical protein C0392_15195 [Syntrophus sp. (in: bacteria)]|nr:hypothetical protein [Syntrophus sp. (in: bacteria)]
MTAMKNERAKRSFAFAALILRASARSLEKGNISEKWLCVLKLQGTLRPSYEASGGSAGD